MCRALPKNSPEAESDDREHGLCTGGSMLIHRSRYNRLFPFYKQMSILVNVPGFVLPNSLSNAACPANSAPSCVGPTRRATPLLFASKSTSSSPLLSANLNRGSRRRRALQLPEILLKSGFDIIVPYDTLVRVLQLAVNNDRSPRYQSAKDSLR